MTLISLNWIVGLCVAACVNLGGMAQAEDAPSPLPAEPDVRICEAYGPGYQVVPGTTTCIKVTGSVEVDATTSGGGGAAQPK